MLKKQAEILMEIIESDLKYLEDLKMIQTVLNPNFSYLLNLCNPQVY